MQAVAATAPCHSVVRRPSGQFTRHRAAAPAQPPPPRWPVPWPIRPITTSPGAAAVQQRHLSDATLQPHLHRERADSSALGVGDVAQLRTSRPPDRPCTQLAVAYPNPPQVLHRRRPRGSHAQLDRRLLSSSFQRRARSIHQTPASAGTGPRRKSRSPASAHAWASNPFLTPGTKGGSIRIRPSFSARRGQR